MHPAGFDNRSALNAHRTKGALTSGNLDVNAVTYVDWFVRNDGPLTVNRPFFTDLYIDDVFIHRWHTGDLAPGSAVGTVDWEGIGERVRITPGEHTLRLVVDPTDVIVESDESDNVIDRTFTWSGTAPSRPDFVKQPNLVAAPPTGRSAPLVASSSPSAPASGSLSVDASTFISWAVRNAGLASIPGDVRVDLFLDGVFVDGRVTRGLLAGQGVAVQAWDGLASTMTVRPGPHTLRLVLDPGDLITESDESDNIYEIELTWGTGEPTDVPEPIAPPTDPPLPERDISGPNLAPLVPFGWDGSVVAKSFNASATPSEGFDGPLSVLAPAYVNFTLRNASPVAANIDFVVELFIDGSSVAELGFAGSPSDYGGVWTGSVTLPAGTVTAGIHTVRVVLDSGGAVNETDESDNAFERQFEWLAGQLPEPDPPASYTREEVENLLAALPELLLVTDDLGGEDAAPEDWTQPVLDAGEAAYFLITGRRLRDERVTIEILPSEEYDARDLAQCISTRAALPAEEYAAAVERCRETGRASIGLTQEAGGRVLVWVREERPPAGVLNVLMHELGHALARLSNREWADTPPGGAHEAFQEAQAQVFEAVAWRHIEEFLGVSFRSYPDHSALREEIEGLIDDRIDGSVEGEPHDLGYVLAWLAVLRERAAPGLGDELRTEGALDPASSLTLYDYLVGMPVGAATSLAGSLLDGAGPFLDEFLGIVLSRPVRDLLQDDEGHPDLREVTFLSP